MPRFTVQSIRNICFLGDAGAGKTSLAEALLKAAGATSAQGSVERGNTVMDFEPQEKQRLHSLNASIASFDYGAGDAAVHINVLDTPGLSDFRGPAFGALSAVETAVVVLNAQRGLDNQAIKWLALAKARGHECVIVVNKIDAESLDLSALLDDLREHVGPQCLALNLPAQRYSEVVDCFFTPSGNADFSSVAQAHQRIIDQVVEINPSLMEHYLDDGEASLSPAELHDAFEQCLREGHLIPVLFTSAKTGAGVPQLLEALVKLFPNPAEGNPEPFTKSDGAQVTAKPDPDQHVIAHVFKIINDPFVGKLSVFRIYQGSVRKDTQLFVGDGRKGFKVAHLYKLFGKEAQEIQLGIAGDICAVAKVEEITLDCILHDSHDEDDWHPRALALPKSMVGLSIEPSVRGQEQKLASALHKLAEEDACLRIEHHIELNETVLRGLGELHLRVAQERLRERYQVEIKTAAPRIAYRETVSTEAEGHHRHKKQTGGAGQFGEVFLRVKPLARGTGFSFVNKVVGGSIPHNFMPAVEKGVHLALQTGAVAGFALQDLEVTVYDGKHHAVDSKEIAFVSAGKKALIDAISRARPVILEPIVTLQAFGPEACMGAITTGLGAKRAKIIGTDAPATGEVMVQAEVPMAELRDYGSELKAQTGGLGSYALEFARYEAVPAAVQRQLIDSYKPHADED
jgi:elongation factor G